MDVDNIIFIFDYLILGYFIDVEPKSFDDSIRTNLLPDSTFHYSDWIQWIFSDYRKLDEEEVDIFYRNIPHPSRIISGTR